MKTILFLYSSVDGQTVKIFKHIEERAMAKMQAPITNVSIDNTLINDIGINIKWIDLDSITETINVNDYDLMIVGASIRYGHLPKSLYQFIKKYEVALNQHSNCSFFLVNLSARKEGKDQPENSVYMKTFLKKSPWKPKRLAIFAGALHYPDYRFFDRFMIKLIMRITGGETDTSKNIEYTNWDKVTEFTDLVMKQNISEKT